MSTPAPQPKRSSWRAYVARSTSPVFVVAANRRLRYANPALEKAIGASFASLRGLKLPLLKTTHSLGSALAPPPEVWDGQTVHVRKAAPGAESGPPWWDLHFVPLKEEGGKVLGVLGFLQVVEDAPKSAPQLPTALAVARVKHGESFTLEAVGTVSVQSRKLASQIRAVANSTAPLWIWGEPGVGKETTARIIQGLGPNRETPCICLDARALQPYLLEGVLFGKGGISSTKIGTLILKYPAELPRDLQERILKWCDSSNGPRLISLSTTTPRTLVESGRLLNLFETQYSAMELFIPPIRERLEDLPQFLKRLQPTSAPGFQSDCFAALAAHTWPDNFRELQQVLCVARAAAGSNPIAKQHLPRWIQERQLIAEHFTPQRESPGLDEILEAVERRMIQQAMRKCGGNQTEAAGRLKIFRTRLGRRIEALGIQWNEPNETAQGEE